MSVQELAARLARRIEAFMQGDPSAVLDKQALQDTDDLAHAASDDGGLSLEMAALVAWVYWYRYMALPDGSEEADLQAAVRIFALMAGQRPDLLPEPIRGRAQEEIAEVASVERRAWRGTELLRRAALEYDPGALDQAVDLLSSAVRETFLQHPERVKRLGNLAAALATRFEQRGRQDDIDKALTVIRLAMDSTPHGSPERPAVLTNLGSILYARFQFNGVRTDLNEAIDTCPFTGLSATVTTSDK
jgi:hypothetical protein